ncbi:MAG: PilZ domain-containing protein [Candidatus Omnitrophica bacterium]|nr:PilZ domain-containing protein [Candidatus Omnitrophota bacterium]
MDADKVKEKRKFPRLKDGVKVIYKFMGVLGEKKDEVLDISQGGIRLCLKEKTRPGTLLELAVVITPDSSPFFALAKVVWQSGKRKLGPKRELYYETGVEFLKMDMQHKMLMIEYIYNRIKKDKKA